jgi:hypothetical protein
MGKIPFELAEPGTDPTKQRNPVRMETSWKTILPWVAILVAFLGLGYVLMGGRLPGLGSTAATDPTATPESATETLTASPTAQETVQFAVTISETRSETATPEAPEVVVLAEGAVLVLYEVDGRKCACDSETGEAWGDDTPLCREHAPEVCDG